MYEGKDSMFPIIDEVKATLEERARMYGSPEDSFDRIGKMWSAYKGCEFSRNDVVIMMILLKVAREAFQHKRDNFIDIIGYAAHAGNFADIPALGKPTEKESAQFNEAFEEAMQEENVNLDEPEDHSVKQAADFLKRIEEMKRKFYERERDNKPQDTPMDRPIWVVPNTPQWPSLHDTYSTKAVDAARQQRISDIADALLKDLLNQHK